MASSDDEAPLALPLGTAQPATEQSVLSYKLADVDRPSQRTSPVPVTIITGYLGSGKSTLVNRILVADHGYRIAVIMNEFGDSMDIESALIKDPQGQMAVPVEEWVELANGCMCCSVKHDFVQALEGLMDRRDKFDYILIETTGLANPGPIATALWTDAELESTVCLDAVVTVVDARNIVRQLHEERDEDGVNGAQQQIAYADVVLLNKVDLASEDELRDIQAQISSINTEASVLRCERCDVALDQILDRGEYLSTSSGPPGAASTPSCARQQQQALPAEAAVSGNSYDNRLQTSPQASIDRRLPSNGPPAVPHSEQDQNNNLRGLREDQIDHASHGEHAHSADSDHGEHDHSEHDHSNRATHNHGLQVGTISLTLAGVLDEAKLRHWLDTLLWERDAAKEDVFRMKGLLCLTASGPAAALNSDARAPNEEAAGDEEASTSQSGLPHASESAGRQPNGTSGQQSMAAGSSGVDPARKYILQAVHELYDVTAGPLWAPDEPRQSKLVVIGRNLSRDALQPSFEACLTS